MKVLVLGATGGTGQHVLSEALQQGHEVTVLVRDAGGLGPNRDKVRVVVGSLPDATPLTEAMRGRW